MSGPFGLFTIRDGERTQAEIAPGRGGMVVRWRVAGEQVFYLDESTFVDPTKNVRGGNPVLFPTPGKLENDQYSQGGQRGSLKQHGFGRTIPWEKALQSIEQATLRLETNDLSSANFPWSFEVLMRHQVAGKSLRIEPTVKNTGTTKMPFGFGFHPYFAVAQADKATLKIPTKANAVYDNLTKQKGKLGGIDLGVKEVDLHLLNHGESQISLVWANGKKIDIKASSEFAHWVIWTVEGKDFVCVEPWTCPGNAMNSGERLLWLEPGEQRNLWVEYTVSQS